MVDYEKFDLANAENLSDLEQKHSVSFFTSWPSLKALAVTMCIFKDWNSELGFMLLCKVLCLVSCRWWKPGFCWLWNWQIGFYNMEWFIFSATVSGTSWWHLGKLSPSHFLPTKLRCYLLLMYCDKCGYIWSNSCSVQQKPPAAESETARVRKTKFMLFMSATVIHHILFKQVSENVPVTPKHSHSMY